jgi:flagellar protein FliS
MAAPNPKAAEQYLRNRVLTATPEQLQLMLFDGALRFSDQARGALEKKNYEESFNLISRVQKIVTELICSLKRSRSPELCDKLLALYHFAYRRLVAANTRHEMQALDEAIQVLRYQRETWAMLMEQMSKTKAAKVADTLDIPSPDARMEASFSLRG